MDTRCVILKESSFVLRQNMSMILRIELVFEFVEHML